MQSGTLATLIIGTSAVCIIELGASRVPLRRDEVVSRYLARRAEQLYEYRATRSLSASNARFNKEAWMEVWTELDPRAGLTYGIVGEGGSEYILKHVLRAALEGEQRALAQGDVGRARIAADNYEFEASGASDDGMMRVLLKPRRHDIFLLDGLMLVTPEDADLVRVEGRLSKNPSFWTRHVDVVRRYARIGGVRVPIELESSAQIRVAGLSLFHMTYHYERINGQQIEALGDRQGSAFRRSPGGSITCYSPQISLSRRVISSNSSSSIVRTSRSSASSLTRARMDGLPVRSIRASRSTCAVAAPAGTTRTAQLSRSRAGNAPLPA
jgi:hypothetical protein